MYEQQILQTLEEIKQALKHMYGEDEQQDGLISNIERNIKVSFQAEIAKLERTLEDTNYKLNQLQKVTVGLNNITKSLHGVDLYDLKGDVDRIHNILVTFDTKLSSIDRKVK